MTLKCIGQFPQVGTRTRGLPYFPRVMAPAEAQAQYGTMQ